MNGNSNPSKLVRTDSVGLHLKKGFPVPGGVVPSTPSSSPQTRSLQTDGLFKPICAPSNSVQTAAIGLHSGSQSRDEKKSDNREQLIKRVGSVSVPTNSANVAAVNDCSDPKPLIDPATVYIPDGQRLVQQALREVMSKGSADRFLKRKHVYGAANSVALVSGTQSGIIPNIIATGTGYNQRVGLQVKLHKLRVKFLLHFYHNNAAFTPTTVAPICMRLNIMCIHVPAVPGTGELFVNTDSNPPGSGQTIWSGLGNAVSNDNLHTVVFNPVSAGVYTNLYDQIMPDVSTHKRSVDSVAQTQLCVNTTGTTYQTYPHQMYTEIEIPLHGRIATYVSGSNNPVANALQLGYVAIFDANINADVTYSLETEFEDVTTE